VHAKDDPLRLYDNAAFAAATIPGARLLSFEAGGHVVMAVQREAIGEAVRAHIAANAGGFAPERVTPVRQPPPQTTPPAR
jgi:pimeloyl-ACP methyl ester carboxylesterase